MNCKGPNEYPYQLPESFAAKQQINDLQQQIIDLQKIAIGFLQQQEEEGFNLYQMGMGEHEEDIQAHLQEEEYQQMAELEGQLQQERENNGGLTNEEQVWYEAIYSKYVQDEERQLQHIINLDLQLQEEQEQAHAQEHLEYEEQEQEQMIMDEIEKELTEVDMLQQEQMQHFQG